MKYFSKAGLLACALIGLSVVSCKSKEEPDDPNKSKERLGSTDAAPDHLIIQEVFYAGNYHVQGTQAFSVGTTYKDDAYIKIYNPTKETKYLDGLALLMTQFSSDAQLELSQSCDHRDTHVGVSTMIQFPGSGKEHAIPAGQSVLVARAAMDHTKDRPSGEKGCPNSFDLTQANFQWLTKEQIADEELPVNEKVPSLTMVYSDGSFFDQESRELSIAKGTGVLALAKIEVDKKELKGEAYEWQCSWNNAAGGHSHGNSATFLKIPNKWIIDAVNLCPKNGFKWYVINRALDKGWTNTNDPVSKERPNGKSLVRKHNGKSYVDSNDSTVDFEEVEASVRKK